MYHVAAIGEAPTPPEAPYPHQDLLDRARQTWPCEPISEETYVSRRETFFAIMKEGLAHLPQADRIEMALRILARVCNAGRHPHALQLFDELGEMAARWQGPP